MTDISRLKVSLTKHNAHKIAQLLKDYRASQILARLGEVHAEKAQAYKNLSVSSDGKLPDVWTKVRSIGDRAIDALVLVGIIFSHHELIAAMSSASKRSRFCGRIERGVQLDGKAYTNFARVIDQLGFAARLDYPGVTFDLRTMFEVRGLGPIVAELLGHKLDMARWNRKGSVADEAVAQGFHRVFGIGKNELKRWLNADIQPAVTGNPLLLKDEEFFQAENEGEEYKSFKFVPGHTERAVEPVTKNASARTKMNRLHNDIQNRLYKYLSSEIGASYVGTENDTGCGTSVDVVTKKSGKTIFYEIKTSPSVRTSIRQAIPQLLEYAYWHDGMRANELVIVSHLPITDAAARYLAFLRAQFEIPLSYLQFDLTKSKLIET